MDSTFKELVNNDDLQIKIGDLLEREKIDSIDVTRLIAEVITETSKPVAVKGYQLSPTTKRYETSLKGYASRIKSRTKNLAKRKGVAFDLPKGWIIKRLKDDTCEYSGETFSRPACKLGRENRGPKPNSPCIKRLDESKGFTVDNCIMVRFDQVNCII